MLAPIQVGSEFKMPFKIRPYLHRMHQLDSNMCVAVNHTSHYRMVRDSFRLVSRLGDGMFWYGLMAAILAHERRIDPDAQVTRYIPELAGTAYGDATLRHVLDMTIGVKYSENYTDPDAEVRYYGVAAGFSMPPAGYKGPETIFDYRIEDFVVSDYAPQAPISAPVAV